MDTRNAIVKNASRVVTSGPALRDSDWEYVKSVAKALRAGETVHRDILLDAARLVDPSVGSGERTDILRRIVLAYDESGIIYRGRD